MTVKELIEKLNEFSPDQRVWFVDPEMSGCAEVKFVELFYDDVLLSSEE